jgi:hypothetical protein
MLKALLNDDLSAFAIMAKILLNSSEIFNSLSNLFYLF